MRSQRFGSVIMLNLNADKKGRLGWGEGKTAGLHTTLLEG